MYWIDFCRRRPCRALAVDQVGNLGWRPSCCGDEAKNVGERFVRRYHRKQLLQTVTSRDQVADVERHIVGHCDPSFRDLRLPSLASQVGPLRTISSPVVFPGSSTFLLSILLRLSTSCQKPVAPKEQPTICLYLMAPNSILDTLEVRPARPPLRSPAFPKMSALSRHAHML